jgi:hypothetical protein
MYPNNASESGLVGLESVTFRKLLESFEFLKVRLKALTHSDSFLADI